MGQETPWCAMLSSPSHAILVFRHKLECHRNTGRHLLEPTYTSCSLIDAGVQVDAGMRWLAITTASHQQEAAPRRSRVCCCWLSVDRGGSPHPACGRKASLRSRRTRRVRCGWGSECVCRPVSRSGAACWHTLFICRSNCVAVFVESHWAELVAALFFVIGWAQGRVSVGGALLLCGR